MIDSLMWFLFSTEHVRVGRNVHLGYFVFRRRVWVGRCVRVME